MLQFEGIKNEQSCAHLLNSIWKRIVNLQHYVRSLWIYCAFGKSLTLSSLTWHCLTKSPALTHKHTPQYKHHERTAFRVNLIDHEQSFFRMHRAHTQCSVLVQCLVRAWKWHCRRQREETQSWCGSASHQCSLGEERLRRHCHTEPNKADTHTDDT